MENNTQLILFFTYKQNKLFGGLQMRSDRYKAKGSIQQHQVKR